MLPVPVPIQEGLCHDRWSLAHRPIHRGKLPQDRLGVHWEILGDRKEIGAWRRVGGVAGWVRGMGWLRLNLEGGVGGWGERNVERQYPLAFAESQPGTQAIIMLEVNLMAPTTIPRYRKMQKPSWNVVRRAC